MFDDYTQYWGCTEFLETLLKFSFFFGSGQSYPQWLKLPPGGGTYYEAYIHILHMPGYTRWLISVGADASGSGLIGFRLFSG